MNVREWLDERLAPLAKECDVPGAAVAVLSGGEIVDAAAGVLNTATGYPVTTDSVFQIGSIAKVWTATLVMRLVDEGRLDLDRPVADYLPGFRVTDPEVSATVTARHLLSHVSGIEGDLYLDTGPGDDALERFIATLEETAPQSFAPGELFSYCNTGYCVLGRVVEVLTGHTFEAEVAERLVAPLGLETVVTSAAEAIVRRVAIGHFDGVPTPVWAMPRSNAPAGATLTMSARDLMVFTGAHLRGGRPILSAESARAMREPQIALPPRTGRRGSHWALGWELFSWEGGTVFGHDGNSVGQTAFLRVVPERNVAVALLTNGGRSTELFQRLFPPLLSGLAGVTVPAAATPPEHPPAVDPRRFTGRYASRALSVEVAEAGRGFTLTLRDDEEIQSLDAVALDADTLISVDAVPDSGAHMSVAFVGDAGGGARFLHLGRALPRVAD
ncbi:serine hydrolase domain-containing protein [Sinosporangium siamense]|uniref:Serine hydrolase n=1 Tax=Sinosporangium siamense TaxID=1367973 RepID=A0A919V7G5_9ACTN|nr:serine hydrolase domain-containing protein [Sinosporangium siamense]GII95100.1 serine hydrolase [Sinosporangium siamense]